VVGDGTASSCTSDALDAAIQKAGVVTFNCGPAPLTIMLTKPLRINNVGGADRLGDTTIDGGGTITLSGGGTTQLLVLDACAAPLNGQPCGSSAHPRLTVQNITLDSGFSSQTCGAAIYVNGGSLKIVNAHLMNNHGAAAGKGLAGGAVAAFMQSQPVFVVNSMVDLNSCASGGALGGSGTSWSIYDSSLSANMATGDASTPGDDGNGGALSSDGDSYGVAICGTTVANNRANGYGGGLFLVSGSGKGVTTIDKSFVGSNDSVKAKTGGGLYLRGTKTSLSNSTIAANMGDLVGGVSVNAGTTGGSIDLVNVTLNRNAAAALSADATITGSLRNCTIAVNDVGIAGGAQIVVANSIIANNDMMNCTDAHPSGGGGDIQFPQGGTACTADVTYGDPLLGMLSDNGGPTETMLPGQGSAVAGAGHACPATDQRGTPRPANSCTSGAVEIP
jgi:hypothetical protein